MKLHIQKLPLNESTSFVARTYRTPNFEVSWHQHIEYELILFTEGAGLTFVGNHIGDFKTGDAYFLGSNLPHTFQRSTNEVIASAIVVQFRDDFWGTDFLTLPECRAIRSLFDRSASGIKLNSDTLKLVTPLIRKLETAAGFSRLLLLGECLQLIAEQAGTSTLSTQDVKTAIGKHSAQLEKVFAYTIDHFTEPIELSQVADIAGLSIPAFCNLFKRCTKKTYIDFLNEMRVSRACNLLMETDMPVREIAFESGYSTPANFHKQFSRVKGISPLQYRKQIAAA